MKKIANLMMYAALMVGASSCTSNVDGIVIGKTDTEVVILTPDKQKVTISTADLQDPRVLGRVRENDGVFVVKQGGKVVDFKVASLCGFWKDQDNETVAIMPNNLAASIDSKSTDYQGWSFDNGDFVMFGIKNANNQKVKFEERMKILTLNEKTLKVKVGDAEKSYKRIEGEELSEYKMKFEKKLKSQRPVQQHKPNQGDAAKKQKPNTPRKPNNKTKN